MKRMNRRPSRTVATVLLAAALVGAGMLADRIWLGRASAEGSVPWPDWIMARRLAAEDHDVSGSGEEDPAGTTLRVVLSPVALTNIGLTTEVARPGTTRRTLRFPGTTRMHPDGVASVGTRIEGKVLSALVAPGDRVEKGQLLARIQSLVPGNPPPTVDLVAPIGGVVATRDAFVGQAVEPNRELFRLIDPRHVVAEARVPERIVDRVRVGQRAQVRRLRNHGEWDGRVTFVGSEADPGTRTYPVWIALSDDGRAPPRPGQLVDIRVVESERTALVVPQGAIVEEGPLEFVFVKRGEAFERRLVATGEEDSRSVEILSGLAAGDTVAVTGSFELMLALESGGAAPTGEDAPHGH